MSVPYSSTSSNKRHDFQKGRFIHSLVFFITTGPKPVRRRLFHFVLFRASSFKWEYPLLSLSSPSCFLRLLPRVPVTSIPPIIFPSITLYRRHFLRKMWPMQLAFLLLVSRRIFLCSLTLSNIFFSHDLSKTARARRLPVVVRL